MFSVIYLDLSITVAFGGRSEVAIFAAADDFYRVCLPFREVPNHVQITRLVIQILSPLCL
jgi:hypothetical protein